MTQDGLFEIWPASVVATSFSDSSYPNWRNNVISATQAAIDSWNDIPNTRLEVYYSTDPNSSITITTTGTSGFADDKWGEATGPENCLPSGSPLKLNNRTKLLSVDRLHFLIAHELGHAFGLFHTNESGGYHIPGTSSTDNQSVMNNASFFSTTSNPSSVPVWSVWYPSGFPVGDRSAIQFLYPSSEYAEAVEVSGGGYDHIKITWTPSSFCVPELNIVIYDGITKVKEATLVSNNGIFSTFSTMGLSSGITYEVVISNPSNPDDQLYDTFSL